MGCSEGHFDNITPIFIALPQKTAYLKSYDNEPKWMYFFTDDEFLSITFVSGVKYAEVLEKNLIVNPYLIINFLKLRKIW